MLTKINILLLLIPGSLSKEYQCYWYGICPLPTVNGTKNYNCAVDAPPKLLATDEARETLKMRCPQLYPDYNVATCCDDEQVMFMHNEFLKAEAIFGRCSTCTQNLLLIMCALNCAPDQRRFGTPTLQGPSDRRYVHELQVRVDPILPQGIYESCKSVINPSTGRPSMEFSCGGYDRTTCNAERWFEYMGNAQANPMTPFDIKYTFWENEKERFTATPLPCNQSYEGSNSCSCIDCDASCPIDDAPTAESFGFTILGLNGIAVVLAIVFGFLGILTTSMILTFSLLGKLKLKDINLPKFLSGFEAVNILLTNIFRTWGTFCAKHPILVLAICSWIIGILAFGIKYMIITTSPVELWAAEDSEARMDKEYFDTHFGPFYRTNQLFIKPTNNKEVWMDTSSGRVKFGPAFQKDFLREVFTLQEHIQKLGVKDGKTLEKICYAPMTLPGSSVTKVEQCAVQSLYGYFGNSLDQFDVESDSDGVTINYLNTLQKCLKNPMNIECLAPYGGPIEPAIIVGGIPKDEGGNVDYRLATGIVLTFLVKNHLNETLLKPALEWELKFVKFLKNYQSDKLDIAFSAERSVQDAIIELSNQETYTVAISYLVMFLYIAIALGKISGIRTFLQESRITLAVSGILIVTASVVCSLGFFGYMGVATTMLAIEVMPFLVLAVGVDNIFILVHAYNRLNRSNYNSISEAIGEAVGQMGPSILQTSASEFACFAIGSLSNMPAVKTFAMYAAGAILLDFLFQITAFVALMSLDQKRYETGRLDLFCCLKIETKDDKKEPMKGLLHKMVENCYAPFLLSRTVKVIVTFLFIAWTCFSILVAPSIELGLDQQLSMPIDSHVYKYFKYMAELLSMGAPIYWVLGPGVQFDDPAKQRLICGGQMCQQDSISTKLYMASKFPNITHLARPASSWLDDYFDWLSVSSCCYVKISDGSHCQSKTGKNDPECKACTIHWDGKRPTSESFNKYLPNFLSDLPNTNCAKGGRAAYSDGVNYILDELEVAHVRESYFMQYSTTAVTSKQFYSALRETRKVSRNIQDTLKTYGLNVKFFPYCIFFVYYEQYLTIWRDSMISLAISLAAIFLVTFLVTGFDIISSMLVLFMVLLILVNMAGLMWLWDISLNAVSLVNLVVSVGIGVEFVSHIIRSYKGAPGNMSERANRALSLTGSSVLSGITLTKFAGIIVLAFSKSQIFQVFYFRMYLLIVLVGAAHGLILLPVLLSVFGPPS